MRPLVFLSGLALAFLGTAARLSAAAPIEIKVPTELPPESPGKPVGSWLDAQVALARLGISCGAIDGVGGSQTVVALQAYQEDRGLPVTGALDDATRAQLVLTSPTLTQMILAREDLERLQPLSPTWLGKSQQTALDYETALELVAERTHANPALIRKLNPNVDWARPAAGMPLTVPAVGRVKPAGMAAHLHIYLAAHVLEIRDADGGLVVHFPVSIAHMAEKRPEGELKVTVVIAGPNYTFDPDVFPESAEGRELGRKLVLPPGPNNPVGVAWIGLDRPGYGIHGTPVPEQVGRTESHGCFRLANWDALTLLDLAWVGLPVIVDP
ncbi:MAG TPA: L,D-transpeptidase [Opitutaceae bacterium]|nr:L,D-transpeptidase [Opitutaceae bacterium]